MDRPRKSKKLLDYETDGSDSEEDFDKETKDEVDEVDIKKRKKGDLGSSSKKKRKEKESDLEQDSDYKEEQRKGFEKRGTLGKVSSNRGKNAKRDSIPSNDELLIKRVEI